MDRVQACEEKFKELFGREPVKDEGDDAEFMRILQRFIFGEVCYVGELCNKTRELITVTVLCVNQTMPQLGAHVSGALNVGCSPLEIREAVYQTAPFIGFPKTLNAIAAMNEVFRSHGIFLPLESAETVTEQDRLEKGLAIQAPIYGTEIANRYSDYPAASAKSVPEFLTGLCFGDFGTRKGLDGKMRELLAVPMLAALGGADMQVKSHVLGAIKAGNSAEDVVSALVHALPYIGFPRALNALNSARTALE